MKNLHNQRPSPTKSSPDIFILSHSKQKKQLHYQKTPKNSILSQNALQSSFKPKNQLQSNKVNQALKNSVENHRQNIDRLTDILKQKSWRKMRKDKSLRIMYKLLSKKIEAFNIPNIIYSLLLYNAQKRDKVIIQEYSQRRNEILGTKGDYVERRSKNFDQNGELIGLINEQEKTKNKKLVLQTTTGQNFQASEEKSRSRSNSQRSLNKNIYVITKNAKVGNSQKTVLKTKSQKVIPFKKEQNTNQKAIKSAENLQKIVQTPQKRGNPEVSQIFNQKTPSFSIVSQKPSQQLRQIVAQIKNENNNQPARLNPKVPNNVHPHTKQQAHQIVAKQNIKKSGVKKPGAAIQNYYFPFFNPASQETPKMPQNIKMRAKSLGKISFSYENKQTQKANDFVSPKKEQSNSELGQGIKYLPLSSRAYRNEQTQNRKRSNSLPKITFTYSSSNQNSRQQTNSNNQLNPQFSPIKPQPEQNKQSNPFVLKESSYVSKNLLTRNTPHKNEVFVLQKKNSALRQLKSRVETPLPKSNQKLFIANSPHLIQLPVGYKQRLQMKDSQYYAIDSKRATQGLRSQLPSRKRVKSYDVFVLRRPDLMKQQKMVVKGAERVRTKSCNPKIQVTLKSPGPLIKVY